MPSIRLTQRRVDALRPSRKVRDIRDAELKGFGVRVMPSGARRYFIHSQHRGKRVWKIIDDAAAIAEPEARARARSMLAALRDGREPAAADPGGTLFETAAEQVFDRYGHRWKPRTLDVNRAYLRRQILPFFAGRPIGEITREDVWAWFRGLQATPAAANRSAPILSVIMQQAEVWGYRPENSNPCAGIRRYRSRLDAGCARHVPHPLRRVPFRLTAPPRAEPRAHDRAAHAVAFPGVTGRTVAVPRSARTCAYAARPTARRHGPRKHERATGNALRDCRRPKFALPARLLCAHSRAQADAPSAFYSRYLYLPRANAAAVLERPEGRLAADGSPPGRSPNCPSTPWSGRAAG